MYFKVISKHCIFSIKATFFKSVQKKQILRYILGSNNRKNYCLKKQDVTLIKALESEDVHSIGQ